MAAEIIDDAEQEPIAREVRRGLAMARQSWRKVGLPLWLRVLIVLGGIVFLLALSPWLIPLAVVVTMLYAGYRVVRFACLKLFWPSEGSRHFARAATTPAVVVKPLPDRASELIGSLLIAAAVTAAMCVVMSLIEAHRDAAFQAEQCAWLFLVSLAGAWVVLIAAKFWEGVEGEQMLRRFVLMTLGLGLGLAAYGAAEAFMVRLPTEAALAGAARAHYHLPDNFYRDGRPQAMAFMAAFATLLALMRWWRAADPMRLTRLSLVSLLVTLVGAHIAALAWQFPEPWLMMVAGCMSVSVQLASPWVPIYARLRPQRKKVI